MEASTETLKKDLQLLSTQLKTLRDEVKVQIHLAGMEAKDVWRKLEPDLDQAAALAQSASAASLATVKDAMARLHKLSDAMAQEAKARRAAKQ